ncbi:aldehyde dehydrogenase family protein [Pajaroellobacter abortibovis]|uniref:aldehyde dehydrogenase family protein n=1 Tax=Pajaroellobacter abortibovis TaxID=1882918 RepID=UPI0015605CED|nr:aldehyde dehydrogenase family protein [Pajaroellobacter abortibovis]
MVSRGPVLGISPFNFPLNLAVHKIAPACAGSRVQCSSENPSSDAAHAPLAEVIRLAGILSGAV